MEQLPIKWILGALGGIGALLFGWLKIKQAENKGYQKAQNERIDQELEAMAEHAKKREKINEETLTLKDCISDWSDVAKLRSEKGITKFSEVGSTSVCKEVGKKTGSNGKARSKRK